MTVKFKKIGDAQVSDVSIAKYTGVTGGKDIVSIISDEHTWATESHYIEGYGSFHCFKGQCCIDYPKKNISYILPIIRYTMTGNKLEYTKPAEFQYLKASKDVYQQIKDLEDAGEQLNNTDLLLNCSDAGYQKIKVTPMRTKNGALWTTDKELKAFVSESIKTYELLIETAVKIKAMDKNKYDGLYDSPEYMNAISSYQNKQQNNNNNNNKLMGNTYVNQLPQIRQINNQQIQASNKPDIIISASDFNDMIDEDI